MAHTLLHPWWSPDGSAVACLAADEELQDCFYPAVCTTDGTLVRCEGAADSTSNLHCTLQSSAPGTREMCCTSKPQLHLYAPPANNLERAPACAVITDNLDMQGAADGESHSPGDWCLGTLRCLGQARGARYQASLRAATFAPPAVPVGLAQRRPACTFAPGCLATGYDREPRGHQGAAAAGPLLAQLPAHICQQKAQDHAHHPESNTSPCTGHVPALCCCLAALSERMYMRATPGKVTGAHCTPHPADPRGSKLETELIRSTAADAVPGGPQPGQRGASRA